MKEENNTYFLRYQDSIKNIRLGKFDTKGYRRTNKNFSKKKLLKISKPKKPKLAVSSIIKHIQFLLKENKLK